MKRIVIAAAALLLAAPAFAQSYPGDDDDSWNQQQPPPQAPPAPQGEDYGYGNTGAQQPYGQPPPQQQPYGGQPPAQQPYGQPPQPQYDPTHGQPPPQPQQGPTIDDFQGDQALASSGVWVDTAQYGRVWRPTRVQPGWQPYLYGRWAWTDAGWAWISEEPFGWATYHYGRWAVLDDGGWGWLPGRVWAPAWVAWRYNDGYAAWCPLGPRGLVYEQPRQWVAVDTRHFLEPAHVYVVPFQRRQEIIYSAQVYRGPRAGPAPLAIGRVTGTTVRPLVITDGGSRRTQVNGGSVQFFRPRTAPVVVTRPVEVHRPEGEHRYVQPYGQPQRPTVHTDAPQERWNERPGQQPQREVARPQEQPPRVVTQPQPPRVVTQPQRQRVVTPQRQPPKPVVQPHPEHREDKDHHEEEHR
jgi:hypothetical protein